MDREIGVMTWWKLCCRVPLYRCNSVSVSCRRPFLPFQLTVSKLGGGDGSQERRWIAKEEIGRKGGDGWQKRRWVAEEEIGCRRGDWSQKRRWVAEEEIGRRRGDG